MEGEGERSYICLFTSQIATTARARSVKPRARNSIWSPRCVTGTQVLKPSSAASRAHQQGAGSEAKQPGLESAVRE